MKTEKTFQMQLQQVNNHSQDVQLKVIFNINSFLLLSFFNLNFLNSKKKKKKNSFKKLKRKRRNSLSLEKILNNQQKSWKHVYILKELKENILMLG